MTTHEIRRRYLDYFVGKGHLLLPSASLVPYEDDPSVLLTIAGMQPLKSYFLGTAEPPARRMVSCQKCCRTPDIDQVGKTARHLTFFEMLGNFSIGDYFKRGAIDYAFELSTEVFGFDPDQIWITVFEGMPGVPADDEAVEYWVDVGIPRERIQALGESENFWKAGPTGPCGPNTELYLDRGPSYGPEGGPSTGTDRFLEYWNLVFMQYDRAADGALTPLPSQNIDTGAGLERMAAIIQDTPSVFDTDAFRPLIAWAEGRSGRVYGRAERDDRALRVLADHGRAMTFLVADGVRPGNEGRDYILRRLIRRAVSEGHHLGLAPDAVPGLSAEVVSGFGDAYPELREREGEIADVLGAEAEQFAHTLAQGQRLLGEVLERSRGAGRVSGDDAFRLYDTYGFPLDLTLEGATDAGLGVDTEGFDRLMADQRERARGAARQRLDEIDQLVARLQSGTAPATIFVGYDELDVTTKVTAFVRFADRDEALVKLERSPFYAEGGGQVADRGTLDWDTGRAEVLDVLRVGDDQIVHVRLRGEHPSAGTEVRATVDAAARRLTQANHTATHILHWALREALGPGARQAGSYVGPDKLRFDFTHRGRVPAETLAQIERRVNERIAEDAPVRATVMSREEAAAEDAIGLFEEKYGERVRVLSTGDYSRELCGGTHVSHTGEIGPIKIVSEASVGSGARRIEAVTGPGAVAWYAGRVSELEAELAERDERLRRLEGEIRRARSGRVDVAALAAEAASVNGVRVLAQEVPAADMDELLELSDRVKRAVGPGAAVVLGARDGDRVYLVANLAKEAVADGRSAAAVMREIAPLVGGGGGGREAMARAGGKDPSRLPEALARAEEILRGG